MGAGGLNGFEDAKIGFTNDLDLDDFEVEEVYETLRLELDKKLREIRVRKIENKIVEEGAKNFLKEKEDNSQNDEDKGRESTQSINTLRLSVLENRLLDKLKEEQPELEINFTPVPKEKIIKKEVILPVIPKKQIKPKALQMMGDEKLEEMSREALPEMAKVTPKALQKLGEEKILPEKLRKRLGSGMGIDQMKAQKAQELQDQIEKQKMMQKSGKFQALQYDGADDQHEVGLGVG
eukprot:augustus_masked-scaffold_17-processed-gene-5.47-mRNA-1 protein AED:1.00 eAED:1.00 QI:0/-1/0/0/-1/1/1/0/235